jgi:uncharacterized membrane protein YfcA
MDLDLPIALAGLVVGFVVGLTGMGGGALMTPILVLLFKVPPLAAISSDIVAAVAMKPLGATVHFRHGKIQFGLVRWLVMGSVPAALLGSYLANHMGHGPELASRLKTALGATLLVASFAIAAKTLIGQRRRPGDSQQAVQVRRLRTLAIGVLGGLVVGLTSVGSGSLMMVLLLLLYPNLSASELVGTDLVQAIPLVMMAALGHFLFGELHVGLTASLIAGSLPGVYLGARLSARAPDRIIRPVLMVVLLASALKLLGVDSDVVAVIGLGLLATIAAVLIVRGRRTRSAAPLEKAE